MCGVCGCVCFTSTYIRNKKSKYAELLLLSGASSELCVCVCSPISSSSKRILSCKIVVKSVVACLRPINCACVMGMA